MARRNGRLRRHYHRGKRMPGAHAEAGPHEASFRSDATDLPALLDFVGRAGRAMALGHEDGLRLELVVEELVANSLAHGGAPADLPLELSLEREDGDVRIGYADRGRAFDPACLAAGRRGGAEGGFGWLLIRRYCPEMSYRRDGPVNRITLRLRLRG